MNENNWKSRWTKDQVKAMLLEQRQVFWQREIGTERSQLVEIERAAPLPHAVIVSGLRRVGKSTLLAQLAHRLGEETFYYINLEDDRCSRRKGLRIRCHGDAATPLFVYAGPAFVLQG